MDGHVAAATRWLTTLARGHGLVESPRWHEGRLWFADWTAGEIIALDDEGRTEVVCRHRSMPLCFDFLPDGRLVLVSNQERAVLVRQADGSLEEYADLAHLSDYGANDITIDDRGLVYVNSCDFDFAAGPPTAERQPGFIALATPDGTARVVADDIAFPNGMAISTNGRTLVVADSYRHQLVGFTVDEDGSLLDRRVWADLGEDNPDGICLDADGACWYADVPHQHCVRVAEGGDVLDVVTLDRGCFACALGGAREPCLYVAAAHWPGFSKLGRPWEWDGGVVRTPVGVGAAR